MNFDLDQFWIWSFLLMAINYFRGRVYVVSVHGENIVFLVFHYTNNTGVIVFGNMDFEWTHVLSLDSKKHCNRSGRKYSDIWDTISAPQGILHCISQDSLSSTGCPLVLSWPLKQLTFSGQDSRELYSSCRDYNATFSFPPVDEWMCPWSASMVRPGFHLWIIPSILLLYF